PPPTSGPLGASDALRLLVAGERDPERRAEALRALAAPGARPAVADLDSAVVATPRDRELRRIRALACARERRPLDASDVLCAANDGELELLVGALLGAGVRGDPAEAVEELKELREKNP